MRLSIKLLMLGVFLTGCTKSQLNPTSTPIMYLPTPSLTETHLPADSTITPATITPTVAIREIEVNSNNERTSLEGFAEHVNSLTWSDDGKTLIISSQQNYLVYFDIQSNKTTINPISNSAISSITLSSDKKTLAVISDNVFADNTSVRFVDLGTGQIIQTIKVEKTPIFIDGGKVLVPYVGTGIFAPNGRVFILSVGTKITLWDVVSGYQIKELFNGDAGDRNFLVYGLFLNPAKNLLFANYYDKNGQSQKEFTFLRWDTDSWQPINTLVGDFSGLSFSPDGNTVTPVRKETNILDSNDFTKLLNFTDARRLGLYSGISMAYDPSGKYFAIVDVVSTDNAGIYYIYLYNASTGKFIRRTSSFIVETLEFSPDGTKLAIGGGSERPGVVTIWDLSQP